MDLWEYCSYNQSSIIAGINRNRTFVGQRNPSRTGTQDICDMLQKYHHNICRGTRSSQ